MKRILLDTSVYGRLAEDPEVVEVLIEGLSKEFIIYGNDTIRKELRETPKYVKHSGKNLRILLLSIYKNLTKEKHELIHNKLIETLSSDYFREYKNQGGSHSNVSMKNDLTIIATATIYNLDIVISDDEKTMLSRSAINAYTITNSLYGLRNPRFLPYKIFKLKLKNHEDFPV